MFSQSFVSCIASYGLLNFDNIVGRDKVLAVMGDWSYTDGQLGGFGAAAPPINGDYCEGMRWFPYAGGEVITVGAATTANGIAGQLPLGAATITTPTITITIASPAVVTDTAHGLSTNTAITLATTGALPTGLAISTTYYVTVIDANTYNLSATKGGSFINTSGTQSGTQTRLSGGYPPSDTFSGRLTRGDGGYGAAVSLTTSAAGSITSVNVLTAGRNYTNTGGSATFTAIDRPWDTSYMVRRMQQVCNVPSWQTALAGKAAGTLEILYIPDDHDTGGNNWDWSSATSPPGATTYPQILDCYRTLKVSMRNVFSTYCNNGYTTETTDLPPTMYSVVGVNGTTASPSDLDRFYFWRDYDDSGNIVAVSASYAGTAVAGGPAVVRQFFLDCIKYKAPQATIDSSATMTLTAAPTGATSATLSSAQTNGTYVWTFGDGSVRYVTVTGGTAASWSQQAAVTSVSTSVTCSKPMLGPTQKAWFKAAMLAATSAGIKAIWINSGKDTYNLDNGDGWASTATPYAIERNELLAYIHTNNIPAVWMTGDRHCAHAALALVTNGDAFDHFALCATPAGQLMGAPTSANDTGNTLYPQMLWQHMGRDQTVYGRWIWDSINQQTIMMCLDMADDTEQFVAVIPAGAHVPSYFRQTRTT